jgi:hypothetical protein
LPYSFCRLEEKKIVEKNAKNTAEEEQSFRV